MLQCTCVIFKRELLKIAAIILAVAKLSEIEAYSKQDADDKRTKINRPSVISLFKFSLFVSIYKSMSLAPS